jgi:hypothetical protein
MTIILAFILIFISIVFHAVAGTLLLTLVGYIVYQTMKFIFRIK